MPRAITTRARVTVVTARSKRDRARELFIRNGKKILLDGTSPPSLIFVSHIPPILIENKTHLRKHPFGELLKKIVKTTFPFSLSNFHLLHRFQFSPDAVELFKAKCRTHWKMLASLFFVFFFTRGIERERHSSHRLIRDVNDKNPHYPRRYCNIVCFPGKQRSAYYFSNGSLYTIEFAQT